MTSHQRSSRLGRIAGAYEHPGRALPGYSLDRLYLEIAAGALADAGLGPNDVDALYTSSTPGSAIALAETLGLRTLAHIDGTDLGGASYVSHAGRASRLIAEGRASVALVIMGGLPKQGISNNVVSGSRREFDRAHGSTLIAEYALVARRHMYEFGTTSRDLAELKAAASFHASHNPNAYLKNEVTVDEVLESPLIADPLHRLDCCVTTDGGGAVVIVSAEVERALGGSLPVIVSQEESFMHSASLPDGRYDLARSISARTGPLALERAGLTVSDVDYASVYDSFTITELLNLEGIGFFEPGGAGDFVRDGALRADRPGLSVNTDGGGLSSNHPDMRGGMIRMIEAVRQVRGTATPTVQVPDCEVAVVHGSGFSLGTHATGSTAVLMRSDVA